MRITIVEPYRYGDIISALPITYHLARTGNEVSWVVHADYASVLEGCSYVRPIVYVGPMKDIPRVIAFAKQTPADRIIIPHVDCNPEKPPRPAKNFIVEQWARAGMVDLFYDLPLVFDRRYEPRELELAKPHWLASGNRRLLLINTSGLSSPYPHRDRLTDHLNPWRGQFNIVDLAELKAERIYDLITLYKVADALISIDTATLHLSYAAKTPTIALVNDIPQQQSHVREHWIERMTYSESATEAGLARIDAALRSILDGKPTFLPRDTNWDRPKTEKYALAR